MDKSFIYKFPIFVCSILATVFGALTLAAQAHYVYAPIYLFFGLMVVAVILRWVAEATK